MGRRGLKTSGVDRPLCSRRASLRTVFIAISVHCGFEVQFDGAMFHEVPGRGQRIAFKKYRVSLWLVLTGGGRGGIVQPLRSLALSQPPQFQVTNEDHHVSMQTEWTRARSCPRAGQGEGCVWFPRGTGPLPQPLKHPFLARRTLLQLPVLPVGTMGGTKMQSLTPTPTAPSQTLQTGPIPYSSLPSPADLFCHLKVPHQQKGRAIIAAKRHTKQEQLCNAGQRCGR